MKQREELRYLLKSCIEGVTNEIIIEEIRIFLINDLAHLIEEEMFNTEQKNSNGMERIRRN